jgi:hypothetical protein
MLMYFFAGYFVNLILSMTKLRVLVLVFSYFTDNSIMWSRKWHNLPPQTLLYKALPITVVLKLVKNSWIFNWELNVLVTDDWPKNPTATLNPELSPILGPEPLPYTKRSLILNFLKSFFQCSKAQPCTNPIRTQANTAKGRLHSPIRETRRGWRRHAQWGGIPHHSLTHEMLQ